VVALWRAAAGERPTTGVDEKLQAAETALPGGEMDARTRNLVGRIAAARATLALTRYQPDTMLAQSRRALEYLDPKSLATRPTRIGRWATRISSTASAPGPAGIYDAIAICQTTGDIFTTILATLGLGNVQEAENQLHAAAETYQRVLQIAGEQPLQIVNEAHLGLARILYEWNDLAAAEQHGQQALVLARQYDRVIDRFILCELFLARLKLAAGDVDGAAALLAQVAQSARQKNFVYRIPDVVAVQCRCCCRQGRPEAVAEAAQVARAHRLPLGQARVCLAQVTRRRAGRAGALAAAGGARDWDDERLKLLVLQALAHQAAGAVEQARRVLVRPWR